MLDRWCGSLRRILPRRTKKPRPASRSFRVDEVGRGCAKYDSDSNREPGFFVIAVEKFFSFRADWHQDHRANPLIRQYQTALDAVVESDSELLGCVTHCRHCGIRFLAHPRNAGRPNLGCPFGCRRHHRRQRASERSAAHYRTAAGKRKKKRLNGRRGACPAVCEPRPEPSQPPTAPPPQPPDELSVPVELRFDGVILDESSLLQSPMLRYVRMIVSLIEGFQLSCQELVTLLRRAMRQHSLAFLSRRDYVRRFLHQHPP